MKKGKAERREGENVGWRVGEKEGGWERGRERERKGGREGGRKGKGQATCNILLLFYTSRFAPLN